MACEDEWRICVPSKLSSVLRLRSIVKKNYCIEINAINQSNLLVTCVVGLRVVCAVVAEFK